MSVIKLTGTVSGVEETTRSLSRTGPAVLARLRAVMGTSAIELRTAFRGGASYFQRRTGRLQRAAYGFVKEKDNVVIIRAGISRRAYYGRFLESGVPRKAVDVKGYVRAGQKLKAPVLNEQTGKVRRRIVAQRIGFVLGHKRTMFVPAHPFVGPAYESLKDHITARILDAVKRETNS